MKNEAIDKNQNNTLQKLATDTGLIIFGLIFSLLPAFIGRVIIVRHWAETDYGIFSLAFSILYICFVIGSLGFSQGIPRSIAYANGKKQDKKIPDFISSSLLYSTIASILLALTIFVLSDFISINIFNEPGLVEPLKIFSFAIPFYVIIGVIVSIFRGFYNVKPTVYFQQILMSVLFPGLLLLVIFFDLPFIYVFYSFAGSIIITGIILIFYSINKIKNLKLLSIKSITSPISRELIIFSLPILGTNILNLFIYWSDTMMLGGLKDAYYVGLYNAALPVAKLLSLPLAALIFIYVPIFSALFAKNNIDEIKRSYRIITKWLVAFTFPFFMIMFLYPEQVLELLFGYNYIISSDALRILSLGFMFSTLAGPCAVTLITMGKSRFILYTSLITAILNVGLNATLIPSMHIMGAAVASLSAVFILNLIQNIKLYKMNKVTPVSKNLIKPIIFTLLIILPIYYFLNMYFTVSLWMIPIIVIIMFIIFLSGIIITRSLDQEDILMLKTVEQKTGLKLNFIKKIIHKTQK